MEFLVRTSVDVRGLDAEAVAELYRREGERTAALRESGALKRLWRVPGRRGTVGIWEAEDATRLHAALSSLPLYPYLDVAVEALATHPSEDESGEVV